ncbi:DUF4097 family beta strand repeat-containing protein [Paenibacillus sp. CAU 1782]
MKFRTFIGLLLVIVGVAGVALVYLDRGNDNVLARLDNITDRLLEEVNLEKSSEIDNIKDIVIDTSGTNVTLVKGSQSQAIATLKGKATPNIAKKINLEVLRSGDKLIIEIEQKGWSFGVNWMNEGLRVELPEAVWNNVTIETGSGNVNIDELHAEQLVIDTGSGNLSLNALELKDLELDSGSGNVKMQDTRTKELTAKVSSGNMKINNVIGDTVELKLGSGNLEIEGYTAETLKFEISSGNAKLIDGRAKVDGKSSSGNITLKAENLFFDTTLKASSGRVVVALENDPESLAVEYKGGSGVGSIKKDGFTYNHKSSERDSIDAVIGSGNIKLNVTTGSGNFTLE